MQTDHFPLVCKINRNGFEMEIDENDCESLALLPCRNAVSFCPFIHVQSKYLFYSCINRSQTYIPLQSFSVERPKDLPLFSGVKSNRKYTVDQYTKPFDLAADFPVLKIQEDFDEIPVTNGTCKTISTQTSLINELNSGRDAKKGSSNSLWTSDESILRGGETVDDDSKSSSSSSACEETGGVISSGKSGKIDWSTSQFISKDKYAKLNGRSK